MTHSAITSPLRICEPPNFHSLFPPSLMPPAESPSLCQRLSRLGREPDNLTWPQRAPVRALAHPITRQISTNPRASPAVPVQMTRLSPAPDDSRHFPAGKTMHPRSIGELTLPAIFAHKQRTSRVMLTGHPPHSSQGQPSLTSGPTTSRERDSGRNRGIVPCPQKY